MTNRNERIGKAMTAIAALLAFSSTPLMAQEAGAPPPVADPLAPEPTTTATPVASDIPPPPAPKPKVETSAKSSAALVSKPKVETGAASRTAKASAPSPARTAARRVTPAAPAAAAVAAPAAEPATPPPPPVEAIPPAPEPVAEPAPPAADPAPAASGGEAMLSQLMADDMLPIAGAGALGLLALGGVGLATRRRRRRREQEEYEARQQWLASSEATPVLELDQPAEVRSEPAFAAAPAIHDPVPDKKATATEPADGFDISKFGPHVQAAYRGPTHDNPSVSLEYRLRKAAILDEQERKAKQEAAERQAPAEPPRSEVEFMLGRGGTNRTRPAVADTGAE